MPLFFWIIGFILFEILSWIVLPNKLNQKIGISFKFLAAMLNLLEKGINPVFYVNFNFRIRYF